MSNLGFDPRPYCERLAKACPERFTFYPDAITPWIDDKPNRDYEIDEPWNLWAFFGPLADEREIDLDRLADIYSGVDDLVKVIDPAPLGMEPEPGIRDKSILESLIVAVVESFESEA